MNKKYLIGIIMLIVIVSINTVSAEKTIKNNEVIDISSWINNNPCNGETILVYGKMHIMSTLHIFPDKSYTYEDHTNYQGMTGVGIDPITLLETGTTYQITGGATYRNEGENYYELNPLIFDGMNVGSKNLINHESEENYIIHFNRKFTVNDDGTIDWKFDNFRAECNK